jgi:Tfp pilus assembly protein FimT
MEGQKGFMLVEVLMTCVIVTILSAMAAVSVVAIHRSDQRTNAVQTLRATAEQMSMSGCVALPTNVTTQGYTFSFVPGACMDNVNIAWNMTAVPTAANNPRSYYINQGPPLLVVRYSDAGTAGVNSPALP